MNEATDMSHVIIPKSDQINAETLLSGPKTVTIKAVHIHGGQEQPVTIELEETNLFFRPCKSMSRVLVAAWGPDAKVYVGRSLTLFRDPTVKWAGMEVGGIRISHMSHLDNKLTLALTATKGSRKPFVVMPLIAEVKNISQAKAKQTADEWADEQIGAVTITASLDSLATLIDRGAKAMAKLEISRRELWEKVNAAYAARRAELEPEGRADEDMGEGFADADPIEGF